MTTTQATTLDDARAEAKKVVRLTERWTPLEPHPEQAKYFWTPVRFCINPSGRRSGKTELAKRKGVRRLLRRSAFPRRILYGAPTFGQARTIFWDDLKALTPKHWIANISESRLEIWTHWGAMIRVFGFDKPQRAEGTPWDDLFLDEMADCPRDCFTNNLRPMLSTRGREGGADLIGVPDEIGRNQAEYEKLWETGLAWNPDPRRAKDPEVCSFHWPSADIVSAREITSATRQMSSFTLRQEYGGLFIRSGGKVIPQFSTASHVRDDAYTRYDPRLPILWSFDFGTRVVAQIMAQFYKGNVWVIDEIRLENSSTNVATDEFIDRASSHNLNLRRGVQVFGDVAGATKGSTLGETDYQIIERIFRARGLNRVEWRQLEAAPLVKDTVNTVRDRFATADGVIHVHIHPRCENLIDDCKTAPWPDGSNNLKEYHFLAALRYLLWSLFGEVTPTLETKPLRLPNLGNPIR